MERIVVALAAGALFSLIPLQKSLAQAPSQPGGPGRQEAGPRNGGRTFQPARERWRQMSPENRQQFRSNAERWFALPPEERQMLRERQGARRQRLQREVEAAREQSGLQLEAEKRALYEQRYLDERRRIERALREELKEKRQRELGPVVEQLKKEFAQPSAKPSSTKPASPSPPK